MRRKRTSLYTAPNFTKVQCFNCLKEYNKKEPVCPNCKEPNQDFEEYGKNKYQEQNEA